MLRDDRQAALDDVIVALENASDAYSDAVDLIQVQDPAMASRFDALARRRAATAARLSEHLRAMGDLPSEPDQDLETLDVLIRHLKAQFAGPEWDELIAEALSHEHEITARVDRAIDAGFSEPVASALERLAEEVRHTVDALRRWRSQHEAE